MKIMKVLLFLVLGVGLAATLILPRIDAYDPEGELNITGLSAPVRILRDGNGIPYVYAENFHDVIVGQGFVTAQDRMFQMEMLRSLSQGRLAELVGERGLTMDTMVHLINVPAQARRQLEILSSEDRDILNAYLLGLNAYLAQRSDELSLPLRADPPSPWTLEDIIGVQIFSSWGSTVNWRQELLTQSLVDHLGVERAAQISQITLNADDPAGTRKASGYSYLESQLGLSYQLDETMPGADSVGSNCWVTGSSLSAGGRPIVSSDPHLDSRRLPGFWYPIGLITPDWRAVGGSVAGGAGIGIGRTNHIAWGITNGYGDMVDLYVETEDPSSPDHYLEGQNRLPFQRREVSLKVRDNSVEGGFRDHTLSIRETRRGPVISDHGMSVASGKLISLRWAVPELYTDVLTTRHLLQAQSAAEAMVAIGHIATPLTFVVADYAGNIGRTGAGFIPLRVTGDGAAPVPVRDGNDSWAGRIPPAEMPQEFNPERDWVASANHRILEQDYPYEYSTFFAHSWRYRRILEAMAERSSWSTADHWDLSLDSKNTLAQQLVPLMLPALQSEPETKEAAKILAQWNFMDDKAQAAPLIFQSILRHYARAVMEDELGVELVDKYLKDYYYWHERIVELTLSGDTDWIDDQRTDAVETREDLFLRAAHDMLAELVPEHGKALAEWRWGDAHTITFSHPLIPGELAAEWLGGGTHGIDGSGETLNRAAYSYHEPYATTFHDSMRLVMDLSDPDKIEAHIPGGVSERLFDSHMTNDVENWLSGTPNYWWFSDAAISEHAVSELLLKP